MPIHITWSDAAIRLLCTVLAGVAIGLDRGEHGRPAGLRTTLLVSLAACVAMIQANALMDTAGKPANSFIELDLMRLPLGILSGMGFIGAGAIVRRDNAVLGVTTAATLWFVTVLGLCFGGGQIAIGLAGLGFGLLVIAGLRPLEAKLARDFRATLTCIATGLSEGELRTRLAGQKFKVKSCAVVYDAAGAEFTCQVMWRASPGDSASIPEVIRELAADPGIARVTWAPSER